MSNLFRKILSFGKVHPLFSFLSFLIAGLNIFFHIPVQIINAVTFLPETQFNIHISWIRILVEPFVGFPLFLLRSSQALEEYFVIWLWLCVIFGILLILRWKNESYFQPLKLFVLSIPAMVGIALFVLVWMVFWPLPANRIVNHSENMILFNAHSHSHFSHDGLMIPEELMKWHEKNGFDAFFLTEHNHNPETLKLVHRQETGQLSQTPHIITGIEFSGSNHLLLLGLTDTLITFGKQDTFAINETHRQGGLVGVAHWFDGQKKSLTHYLDTGIDGFEIANQNLISYPKEIHDKMVRLCRENHLFLLSNADYHGYGPTCNTWNGLEIPHWNDLNHRKKTEVILKGLKEGKTKTLFYHDRANTIQGNIWISPLYYWLNYFRGLNGWQLFSWLLWSLWILYKKINCSPRRMMTWNPFIAGISLFIQGEILLSRSGDVLKTNEIYLEYGHLLFNSGLALFIAGAILFILFKRFPQWVRVPDRY